MNDLEQTIVQEISTLPAERRADVLAFIRYLKLSLRDEKRLKKEFEDAVKVARETARKNNITQEDIDAEIRAVREGK